jgi:hypothetical protein
MIVGQSSPDGRRAAAVFGLHGVRSVERGPTGVRRTKEERARSGLHFQMFFFLANVKTLRGIRRQLMDVTMLKIFFIIK